MIGEGVGRGAWALAVVVEEGWLSRVTLVLALRIISCGIRRDTIGYNTFPFR